MKLTFLGAGSAFTTGTDNYQSNMLLEFKDKSMLVDCGTDIRYSLDDYGVMYSQITDVYISHLHADHVGGLEWLAFKSYFDKKCPKPRLHIMPDLVNMLWNNVLKGGLSSLEGICATLDTYFDVMLINNNKFNLLDLDISVHATDHIYSNHKKMPCYGLCFHTNSDKKIFLTTDSKYTPEKFSNLFDKSTMIFHDCETSNFKSGVHAHYSELVTLPLNIKNKMWLYHYNPGDLPNAKNDGFLGFVNKGQTFIF